MLLQTMKERRIRIFFVLLIVILVSCNTNGEVINQAITPAHHASTPSAMENTLQPTPKCFGLFVEMLDQHSGSLQLPTVSRKHNGTVITQRAYRFKVGEPITVTVNVLVFDAGELVVERVDPIQDYTITITDKHGQELSLKEEAKGYTRARGMAVVNQVTPYIESFRIDTLYDISQTGLYTLTVSRVVSIHNVGTYQIEGNPVLFSVR